MAKIAVLLFVVFVGAVLSQASKLELSILRQKNFEHLSAKEFVAAAAQAAHDKFASRLVGAHPVEYTSNFTTPVATANLLQYITGVGFGTPEQLQVLAFDTGSSFLWVYGEACPSYLPPCQDPSEKYNPKLSSTYVHNGTSFEVTYNSGSVSGILAEDTVWIGNSKDNLKVVSVMFGMATTETGITDATLSGVWGANFPTGTIDSVQPLLYTLWEEGVVYDQSFSVYFPSAIIPDVGYLIVGGISEEYTAAPFTYFDVLLYQTINQPIYWALNITTATLGQTTVNVGGVLFDTGSTAIYGPSEQINAINAAIGRITCLNIDSLPTVTLDFGGYSIDIEPASYVVKLNDECITGFIVGSAPVPGFIEWIFGDIFFRETAVHFDEANLQMGFAPMKNVP